MRFKSNLYIKIQNKIHQLTLFIALFSCISLAHSTDMFGEIGLHIGGDDIALSTYDSAMAGGIISVSAGIIFTIDDDLEFRTSIGKKYDSSKGTIPVIGIVLSDSDSDYLSFARCPLELMLITNNTKGINYGIGITYHLNPELRSHSTLFDDVEFNNALGFVAELDLELGTNAYVGIKYTSIDYETDNQNIGILVGDANFINKKTIDGNSIGLVIGMHF